MDIYFCDTNSDNIQYITTYMPACNDGGYTIILNYVLLLLLFV